MTRKEKKTYADESTAAFFEIETVLEIWGTNATLEEKKVTLEVASFELDSEWTDTWSREVALPPNASTELWKGELPGQPKRTKASEVPRTIVVSARLLDADGTVLGRYSNWCVPEIGFMVVVVSDAGPSRPEPFKFINFPSVEEVGLKITSSQDGESVELSTKKPIKGIVLDVDGDAVKWSDQAIDLVPGDPQVVKAVGLKGREIKARYLGDGTA